jgi:hypothetical protein
MKSPNAASGEDGRRVGDPRPRLCSVPPAVSSAGSEAVDLAGRAGLHLDPWQAWVLDRALAERDDGKWAAWEIGLIIPRQNGKSAILEARELAGLVLFGETLIIHTAHEFRTSQEAFRRIRRLIEATPELDSAVMRMPESHGEEGIEFRGGKRLRFLARSKTAARGFSCDLLVYDEAMILPSDVVGSSLPTMSARSMATAGGTQVWYTGSAGLGAVSTQLALIRGRGIQGDDEALFFAEWSIDPHTPYCDPGCTEHDEIYALDSLYKSNPGLGYIHSDGTGLTLEAVEREARGMDAEQYATERLDVGTYPAPKDGWAVIPKRWWLATADDSAPRPAGPAFSIDTTPKRTHSSIALAGDGSAGKVYLELADHRAGTSWLLNRALELDRRWSPVGWAIDPRAAAGSLIDDMVTSGLNVIQPTARDMAHAFGGIYDDFRDDMLTHATDKEVATALAGAVTRKLGDGLAWDRVNSAVVLSPVVAYTLAHWLFRKLGGDSYDAGDSVHFDLTEIIRLCQMGVYGPADIARLFAAELIDDRGLTELKKATGRDYSALVRA